MKSHFLHNFLLALMIFGITQAGTARELSFTPVLNDSIVTADSFFIQIADCTAGAEVCIDVPLSEAENYQILVDGQPYSRGMNGCDFDTISAYTYTTLFGQGELGPYELTKWEVSGTIFSGDFANIPDLVDSMNTWDPLGNWQLDSMARLIVGGYPGNVYSDMDVQVIIINSPSFIGYNFGLEANGTALNFEVGFNQEAILIHNTNGDRDTFLVSVACITTDTVYRNVQIDDPPGSYCIDFSELSTPPDTVYNFCSDMSGSSVLFNLIDNNPCVEFSSIQAGTDTACIVACDQNALCDTTYLVVQVGALQGQSRNFLDEIYIGQAKTYCLNQGNFSGGIDTAYNICEQNSGAYVSFSLDNESYCVDYLGIEEGGSDSICYVLCDQQICDTTFLIINVLPLPGGARNVVDTVVVGGTDEYCIELSELPGTIDTIYNACTGSSGNKVSFIINTDSYCVEYTGLNLGGPDSACIIICDDIGACDTTNIYVHVTLPTPDTIRQTVLLGASRQYCIDTTELLGTIAEIENFCPASSGNSVDIEIDTINYCLQYSGAAFADPDTVCIVLTDSFGMKDTTIFYFRTVPPAPENHYDTIVPRQSAIFCLDTTELIAVVDTVFNGCPETAHTGTSYSLDTSSYCVTYTGLQPAGIDTACYILCNDRGVCDTSYLFITIRDVVLTPSFIFDTITINTSKTECVSSDELPANIINLTNGCQDVSGEYVNFRDFTTGCLSYEAIDIGTDTACLYLTDELGYVDTIFLVVTVKFPEPQIVRATINLDETATFCLNTDELGGEINSVFNNCPASSGSAVNAILDTITLCLNVSTIAVGTDSICMVLCDDFNVCDTTTYILTVVDPAVTTIPNAVDDSGTTSQNATVFINVLNNDIIPNDGNDPILEIINSPGNGTASFSPLGDLIYTPDPDFCDAEDILTYSVCNISGCDTALVRIFVSCDPSSRDLTIYDGFSPNGDGINDVYTIRNIELYPNYKLTIFNRWGNILFENEEPSDRWDGKWEGNDLPNGIYFYLLNDGEGNVFSGYLLLQR